MIGFKTFLVGILPNLLAAVSAVNLPVLTSASLSRTRQRNTSDVCRCVFSFMLYEFRDAYIFTHGLDDRFIYLLSRPIHQESASYPVEYQSALVGPTGGNWDFATISAAIAQLPALYMLSQNVQSVPVCCF